MAACTLQFVIDTRARSPGSQRAVRWSKRVAMQRYLRLLARLPGMSPAEVAVRGVQMPLRKLLRSNGRLFSSNGHVQATRREFVERLGPSPRECLARRLETRFFFGPSFGQRMNEPDLLDALAPARLAELADRMYAGSFEILGVPVRLVPGLDWQSDPRSMSRVWTDGPLDETTATRSRRADVKYVWEVNRHQFLTILGRAYWQTGEARFAERASSLVEDWIESNPFGHGVNWSSHLEVAMRAISWLWTMPYLVSWSNVDDRFLRRWLESLLDHYQHLRTNLSIYTDPTNHLLGETTALWMLSAVFPELPDASQARARAMDILAREVGRQFTCDGVNKEQATSYARFVLDFLLQIIALARKLGEPVPSIVHQRTCEALAFVAALMGPLGDVPMIGDSDDARGVPLPEANGWDFRDLLSTGAVLFTRADWKKPAGRLAEATVWLLGPEGSRAFHRLERTDPEKRTAIFIHGGYCIFEAETAGLHVNSIFDLGPLGLWPNAAHGHADALSLLIRVNDELLLGDPGTGTYFENPAVRDWFRSTAAHNTVTVDHLDQADALDVFKWVNPIRTDLLASFSGEHFDYAVARHNGYGRLRRAVTQYRHILLVRPACWIVVDYLEGRGHHVITRRFHLAPGTALHRDPFGPVQAVSSTTGAGLRFTFAETGQPNVDIRLDEPSWWSPRYGTWTAAPCLTVEASGSLPLALCTVITAFGGDRQTGRTSRASHLAPRTSHFAPCTLHLACDVRPDGTVWLWRCPTEGGEPLILLNPKGRPVPLPDGRVSDASFLFLTHAPDRKDELVFQVGRSTCEERVGPASRRTA